MSESNYLCDCEPVVYVNNGYLPNQRDIESFSKELDIEKIGEVFVVREGDYSGHWAIKTSGKLYIFNKENIHTSLANKKKENL